MPARTVGQVLDCIYTPTRSPAKHGSDMSDSNKLGPPWTTLKILNWTTQYFEKNGIPSPRVDAEHLLGHALGLERIMLYAHFDRPLDKDELAKIRGMVKRRAQHEPIAYITGSRGFWTIDLKTDKRALIPRPDTETLVEAALARIPAESTAKIIDVGTGTGAIALAIAHERPTCSLAATDISEDALGLAQENAAALGLTERVEFFQGDLLDALAGAWTAPVDVITSNPPYIGTDEEDVMGEDVKRFEPHQALFAGDKGLDVIEKLVPQAHANLKPDGWFLCEIGYRQADEVRAIFEGAGFCQIEVLKDLGQNDRVVLGRKA